MTVEPPIQTYLAHVAPGGFLAANDLIHGVKNTKLQHGQGMQRNIWTRPGIWSWRQVIGVRLAGHFENAEGHLGTRKDHAPPAKKI